MEAVHFQLTGYYKHPKRHISLEKVKENNGR